jgi:1-acyl-sn-glycerol-3-phosphate acyltransferase
VIRSWVARAIIRLIGWQIVGQPPQHLPKYVTIGVPHTSNWDVPLLIIFGWVYRMDMRWMMKAEMFKGVRGPFFRWLGGMPIERNQRKNTVQQCIEAFNENERMILLLSPEGTRSITKGWKSGFYYIALGAKVPIACSFLDYTRKQGGFGPTVMPSGDIEADMAIIADFYKDKQGKYPDQFGEIRMLGKDE